MLEQVVLANTYVIFISGVLAFLLQFATLIWRIAKAEHRIHVRIGNVERDLQEDIQKVRLELVEAKLEVANSYMRRETFKDMVSNIDARLIRLEGKLDAAIALK